MLDDLHLLYVLSKYKIGIIFKPELMIEIKNYIKRKGPIFIKFFQIFLLNNYKFNNKFKKEEIEEIKLILDNVYDNYEEADFQIGCGSVAYVFFDKSDKSKVIKKIIPNITDKINESAEKFNQILNISTYIADFSFDKDDVNDYKKLLIDQTDLIQEKSNLERMKTMFQDFKDIKIPQVFESNKEMIKMEYCEGIKLFEFIKKYPEKKEYCKSILLFCFKVMINNKFFHGDLHEGNLLFSLDIKNNLNISLIDFGLVFEITDDEKQIFEDFAKI